MIYLCKPLDHFSEHIRTILKTLPDSPGVYRYYDADNNLLYVGKAKNLKKRVLSYFMKEHDTHRLRIMVKKIADIKTTQVNTEMDALILENNLIKNLTPRYNIQLRDDKTYPWLLIRNEKFPRVHQTRQMKKDGSEYFGPYPSVTTMYILLDLIRQLYPLRSCNLDLTIENIEKKKFKACLEFQIGRCKAPCIGNQSLDDYEKGVNHIREIIKGDINFAIRDLKRLMNDHAEKLEFEKAGELKKKIELLEKYQGKSTIVHPSITDTDVFTILSDDKVAYINYFKVMNGTIIQAQTLEFKKKLDESDEEMLVFAINEIRTRYNSLSKEIFVPFEPEFVFSDAKYVVPKIGDKKHLMDLGFRNVEAYKKEREKQLALIDPDRHTDRIMQQMMKDLRMKEEPRRIEGFDNSNIQGEYAVSAMPVFIDGKPAKKEYRHFNVKTVVGPDDFATMEEVISRRYSRVLEEGLPMPQLIVIDGGKGQLGAAVNSLRKLGLIGKVTVIGIAKRLEEIYFPGDPVPLYLDKRSETLKVIQQIRDEAHRFGITHHRNKRSRETFKTELSEIRGISEKTAQKLLTQLKSVKGIKEATLEELITIIGKSKANLVYDFFKMRAEKPS
ncbi:MAG: UvrABC system protein [Bacteroidota bacterium]|jgi:excinuclease ABC subunit C|nr:UvrABC system protein [Bacteroidota bacterium]